jgi:8-oxo-dGTP pyrophosphatase MutT (NUDIX family)
MPHQTVVKSSGATGADLTIAAGGLLWRKRNGQWEIAIVHRRRYGGDYTLPKGKVQRDETPLACALREVREETGWAAEPVDFAGQVTYPTNGTRKLVLFWTMRGDRELESGVDNDEVAEVLWLPAKKAMQQLSYPVERDLLARVTGTAIETTSSRVQRII